MCRIERITDDARIQDEMIVYAGLLPNPRELSATMMIEIEDKEKIQPVLGAFLGIDLGQHVWIQVGKEFVRFAFPKAAVRAFRNAPVFLVVDHAAERDWRTLLGDESRLAPGSREVSGRRGLSAW